MYDRIAGALDGSVTASGAIGPARRLARADDARLVLVSVATSPADGAANATAVLDEGRRRAGGSTETLAIDGDDAAFALADFTAADPARWSA